MTFSLINDKCLGIKYTEFKTYITRSFGNIVKCHSLNSVSLGVKGHFPSRKANSRLGSQFMLICYA